jgi:hypothetical protein
MTEQIIGYVETWSRIYAIIVKDKEVVVQETELQSSDV